MDRAQNSDAPSGTAQPLLRRLAGLWRSDHGAAPDAGESHAERLHHQLDEIATFLAN